MTKKSMYLKLISFLVLFSFVLLMSSLKNIDQNQSLAKPLTNDDYNYIAINNILMYVSNNGDGSHDPSTDGSGFYWPGGINATQTAIFEDGLIWGGMVNGQVRMNGNTHRQGLQAGKILSNGQADNPANPRYRVFKIRKDWRTLDAGTERDEYERDFNEWPMEDGAPYIDVDNNGMYTAGVDTPYFIGDEVLWYVANDLDETRSTFTYGSPSIGLEFQTTIFGYARTDALGDVVFKKYLMINKSQNTIDSMFVAYWSDTDLGQATDDAVGCDTLTSLGYIYNFDNDDEDNYGVNPPAVGYDFFQGPAIYTGNANDYAKFLGKWRQYYRNLPMTAFTIYANGYNAIPDPTQGNYNGSIQFYNYMNGLMQDGSPFIDPLTSNATNFVCPGDPVTNSGWHWLTWPGGPGPQDVRHMQASGPFTLAPGDSQEVVVGIMIARGSSNLRSISKLKRWDRIAQRAYDDDFNITSPPPTPKIHSYVSDKQVTLWWEDNAESHTFEPDTSYHFEGYRLWQFSDITGSDATELGVYDISNATTVIYDYVDVNGEDILGPVIQGNNSGLRRSITITNDAINGTLLRNGNPYYFAVTAYGFSTLNEPFILESQANIIEVFPGTKRIDVNTPVESGEMIFANQVEGVGDATISINIVDPSVLTGDTYSVEFGGSLITPTYSLINESKSDTLILNSSNFSSDLTNNLVYDGFKMSVQNAGAVGIGAGLGSFEIQEVLEIKGPSGVDIENPIDVIESLNSTGQWKINSYTQRGGINSFDSNIKTKLDWQDRLGYGSYEIRFTSSGSEYYCSGSGTGPFPLNRSDFKAANKVPFEIWSIGESSGTEDDVRLTIKVLDDYTSLFQMDSVFVKNDSVWSYKGNRGFWEPVYAYFVDSTYSEPLPDPSGTTTSANHKIGCIIFEGSELPAEGTVIRINAWKPVGPGDIFEFTVNPPKKDLSSAKSRLDMISVFPNPYFGVNPLERDKYQRFVRFTNLPEQASIRIFSLAGVLITKLEKNDASTEFFDWNLNNRDNLPVGSGIYIAYIEMPGIGTKVLKLAIIQETQFIDRI